MLDSTFLMRVVFEEGLFTIAAYHCRAGWRSLRKLLGLSVPDTPLVSPYDKAFAIDRAKREEEMMHAGEVSK
ncbi:Arabinose-proton symporter [Galdieria sulphuraria]|nr:Arabinose-proton symporter [Galdieria sulphuraria]